MNSTIIYHKDSYLPFRFFNLARLALSPTIQQHEKNFIESMGNIALLPAENLPRTIRFCLTDPKIITIALTAFSMLGNSYLFYPEETLTHITWAVSLLENIPFWAVKFSAYILTSNTIIGYGAPAYGRFSNAKLMQDFYLLSAPVAQQA